MGGKGLPALNKDFLTKLVEKRQTTAEPNINILTSTLYYRSIMTAAKRQNNAKDAALILLAQNPYRPLPGLDQTEDDG